jgi:allantoinase
VPSDLVIRGATLPQGAEADVAIDGESIAEIGDALAGREEVDARGLHLLPGVVDAHVHFNEPGRTHWEGWATGSRALLAGGATACIEMPLNAHPPTLDGPAFDAKVEAATASSVVDFALWGGLTPVNLDRLEELAERGVVGFKAFMCDSGIDDFPAADDDTLRAGMATAATLGLPVAVHAERPARLRTPDGGDWRAWVASRPVEAELEAIETAIAMARETGCSLHVVHVSSAAGVELVAGAEGVTCETCPHYLTLSEDDLETLGTRAKCAPPLRRRHEVEALWREVEAGRIAFVASDHSPCPPAMKGLDPGGPPAGGEPRDFMAAWGGIAGAQATLGLLLERLPPGAVAALTAANPAARFGLPKGRLEPGADADLVLVDLRDRHVPELQDRHKLSPYAGRPLPRVVRTWLRGGATRGRVITPRKDPA